MTSLKNLMIFISCISISHLTNAQIKVFSGGKTIIGATSTPSYGAKLQVSGPTIFTTGTVTPTSSAYIRSRTAYSTSAFPDYTWAGDTTTGIFHPAASVIGFSIASNEKMRFTATGLGIGKTPSYELDVNGNINIPASTSYGYRIGGWVVLTQRNIASSIFVGDGAGASTTGASNSVLGYQALFTNASGTNNTAMGYWALNKTTVSNNSAFGQKAAYNTSTGASNNAFGSFALYTNTTSSNNCAFGDSALYSNTIYGSNVAIGSLSQKNNYAGGSTSLGYKSMYANTSGPNNTAVGYTALQKNTTTGNNTAVGHAALTNTTNNYNTAVGSLALTNNTSGHSNTAVGYLAGAVCTTGYRNTCIGTGADVSANNLYEATSIGYNTIAQANNSVTIGNSALGAIYGHVTSITSYSDGRYKTDVQENVKGLEFIKKLRPVTYKVNTEAVEDHLIQNMPDSVKQKHKTGMDFAGSSARIHSGFIAQEVELAAQQVGFNSSIVHHPADENGLYGLGYSELVVPLVKAMQEQNAQVDSLIKTTEKLDSINRLLQNQLNDVVNNCCKRAPVTGTTGRTINSDAAQQENLNQEQNNWLAQNKPNPFNKETVIEYNVVQEGKGSIMIFDMNGKLLKTITVKIPGKGSVTVNANDFAPGMYYYTLVVNDAEVDTKKMILTE